MKIAKSLFLKSTMALVAIVVATTTSSQAQTKNPTDPSKVAFFEKKIRPILVDHCYTCHSADTKPAGGLRVDDRNGLLIGGNTGPAIVPGEPAKSLLLQRVKHENPKRVMPQEGDKLTAAEIADLTQWIQDGAAWPALRLPKSLGQDKPEYDAIKKSHWAWQPITDPKVPVVKNQDWARDEIDRFLLAKLESKGLTPVGDADATSLIRRLYFDLTGLPPTPDEIDTFLTATALAPREAVEKLVDRLLTSPQFGERWGRHWLDIARYGESTGPSRNIPYPHAWKYRDYVIDSFNRDIPFDQLIREQIAGDLLPAESSTDRDRLLTATGFLALGVKDVNQRFKVRFIMDNVDEQIDAVTRSVLGLTVSCARCHDHKFDPIPTTDYYALAGIFTSTDNCAGVRNKMGGGGLDYYDPSMLVKLSSGGPVVPAEEVEKLKEELAAAKKEWDAIRGTPEGTKVAANGFPTQRPFRLKYEKLQGEFDALTDPATRGHAVHGVRDAKTIGDTEVRLRGEAEKLGPSVPRGFLTAFSVPDVTKINPKQSGRLDLAQWLSSPKNPLTPRVAVNRIWQHLFGEGIVSTVDNFGVTGDVPSHPELLDHLATRFIREGWSIKKLVRTLVLTRAYQLASETNEAARQIDPANRLVWRHAPRRLDAEEIRDAMLKATGKLNPNRPQGSPAQELKMIEMRDNGPEARTVHDRGDDSLHRSVYLPLVRGVVPRHLEAFDPVDQTLVTGKRDITTVPTQALFLLNSSFVRQQSLRIAESLLADENATDEDRVRKAYRLSLGRVPEQKELDRVRIFLAEYESEYRETTFIDPPPRPKAKQPRPKADMIPANPDDLEQTGEAIADEFVRPKDPRTAAWLAFVQSLFGSTEFRYVK